MKKPSIVSLIILFVTVMMLSGCILPPFPGGGDGGHRDRGRGGGHGGGDGHRDGGGRH